MCLWVCMSLNGEPVVQNHKGNGCSVIFLEYCLEYCYCLEFRFEMIDNEISTKSQPMLLG